MNISAYGPSHTVSTGFYAPASVDSIKSNLPLFSILKLQHTWHEIPTKLGLIPNSPLFQKLQRESLRSTHKSLFCVNSGWTMWQVKTSWVTLRTKIDHIEWESREELTDANLPIPTLNQIVKSVQLTQSPDQGTNFLLLETNPVGVRQGCCIFCIQTTQTSVLELPILVTVQDCLISTLTAAFQWYHLKPLSQHFWF